MMKPRKYRIVSLLASLTLIALLGGQAFACLFPAPPASMNMGNMGEGSAMACCEQHCRVETTPQAAQQACQQSHAAISQQQAFAKSPISFVTLKDLLTAGLYATHDPPASPMISSLFLITADALAPSGRTVALYLFTHSLLI
jgi:hypothetical protein